MARELGDERAVPVRLGVVARLLEGAGGLVESPEVEERFRLVERVVGLPRVLERALEVAHLEPRPGEVVVELEPRFRLGRRHRRRGARDEFVEGAPLGEAVEIGEHQGHSPRGLDV